MWLPGTKRDETAARLVRTIERALAGHPAQRMDGFRSVLDAIEIQIGDGRGSPTVLRHLGEALLALAATHQLPAPVVQTITQALGELHRHAAGRVGPGGR